MRERSLQSQERSLFKIMDFQKVKLEMDFQKKWISRNPEMDFQNIISLDRVRKRVCLV